MDRPERVRVTLPSVTSLLSCRMVESFLKRLWVSFASLLFLFRSVANAADSSHHLVTGRTLVTIESAAPQVLVLVFIDNNDASPPSQRNDDYHINGSSPLRVGRHSATLYEERCLDWSKQIYPQIIGHRLYLLLSTNLQEGLTYRIEFPGGTTNFHFQSATTLCESFKVNQVGYSALSGRRAAFFAPWCGDLGVPSNSFVSKVTLCETASGREVQSLRLQSLPQDSLNGGIAWRVDLSSLTNAGAYFLNMPGVGRSPEFGFGDAFAHHAYYAHMKGFYHQRCGTALTKPFTEWERPACHAEAEVTDAKPPEFIKERSTNHIHREGGHHDAGDFDIRIPHTLVAGWLLNAYELFPQKFIDGQLDLPESGNGIPDLLDEALYSIRAWEVLQEPDGGIRGGFEADREPVYGEANASTDKLIYRTYARNGHTTLVGAALMAYAGRMIKPFDRDHATALQSRAEKAWAFYRQHQEDAAYRWSPGALLFASCQLYLATGNPEFHETFKQQARYFFELDGQKSKWPAQYHGTYFNLETIEKGAAFTHYFASYLLNDTFPKDERIRQAARTAVLRKADEQLKKLATGGFATISTGSWGASTGVGRYGDFLIHAWRLTGDTRYRDAAAQLADWSLGANPAGWCFTTGIGSRPPYNPLQLDSYFQLPKQLGPVPGLVIYGITEPPGKSPYIRAVTQHCYPPMEQLPPARRITDGWSVVEQNEFTVWETMAPNAFLHACLAPDKPLRGQLVPWSGVRLPGGYPIRAEK
jgi:endoglucanase